MEMYGRVADLAQTPKCLAQTHTFAAKGSPSPTVCSQRGAQVTQEMPGGNCHHQLCLTSPSCWVPAAVMQHTALGGQRPEVKGQPWQRL